MRNPFFKVFFSLLATLGVTAAQAPAQAGDAAPETFTQRLDDVRGKLAEAEANSHGSGEASALDSLKAAWCNWGNWNNWCNWNNWRNHWANYWGNC